MLLSEPFDELNYFFKMSLIKFYLNSQRMSDSFYHITELTLYHTIPTFYDPGKEAF